MNSLNKKIIYISSTMVAIALIFVTILLIHSYNNNKRNQILETYGIVKKVNNDSIIVEESGTNNEITFIKDGKTEDFNEGDLIVVKTKDKKIQSYDVIVNNYDSTTTTSQVITSAPSIITSTTTTTSGTTTTTTTYSIDWDYIVVHEVEDMKNSIKNTNIKDKAKNVFTTLVDFIFYGGKIKGVTFNQLTTYGKAKVIYYTLLIDSEIDNKFPGYKDFLSDKYNDVKGKLIAEYLELKYTECNKHPEVCESLSNDLGILKKSLNLTWDIIKDTFIYIKDLSVPKIKSWYEAFRG